MSIAENKAVDRRLIEEALNQGDLAVVEELIATEFVDHDGPPGMRDGPNGFKAAVIAWRTAFPNLQVTIEEQVSEGDRVGHRVTMRGIHTGDLFGIPPTGKSVVSEGVHLIRLAGGQLVEHWGINDDLGMLQQLGVIPTPAPAESAPRLESARGGTTGEPSISGEENKAVIRRLIDGFWNDGEEAVFDEVFAPDYFDHNPAPGQSADREGFRQLAAGFRVALPDMHSTVDDLVAEGDRVAWRYSLRATHGGTLMGIPATGKQITLTGITIDCFAGGQIVERWSQLDTLGLLQQLGVIPTTVLTRQLA